jgi:hypothetical protein
VKLKLVRVTLTPQSTIGCLYIDGAFECYTLEDVVRADGIKVFGETAIPKGTYAVDITPSPRFKRELPLLTNVQGFVGIRIHPGNTASDTEGCILVGQGKGANVITSSVKAFNALFPKLQAAKARGESILIDVGV